MKEEKHSYIKGLLHGIVAARMERRVVLYITSPRSYRTDRRYNDQNECSTDS